MSRCSNDRRIPTLLEVALAPRDCETLPMQIRKRLLECRTTGSSAGLMPSLIRCIYSSVASANFSEDQIPALLSHARTSNAKRGVTGLLAYIDGNFLQVIEGTEVAIDDLLAKISVDPRHKRLLVIVREPIAARSFADWSMGFEALLPADLEAIVGENDFFDSGSCMDALDPGLVKTILFAFRKAQTEKA